MMAFGPLISPCLLMGTIVSPEKYGIQNTQILFLLFCVNILFLFGLLFN